MKPESSKHQRDYYFESIGDDFDKWMSDYDVCRRISLIRRHVRNRALDKSCFEVGCGTGKISEALRGCVGTLTVSDISETLARSVGERLGVSWSQQNACALNIPDHSFDVVISSECIEHVPDPRKALQEMVRVLKPGGFLVVTSPNKLWYPVIWVSMATKLRRFTGRETWLFPMQAANTVKFAGLREVQLDGCHLFPWQIPLAKRCLPIFDSVGKLLYPFMINYCVTGSKPLSGGHD